MFQKKSDSWAPAGLVRSAHGCRNFHQYWKSKSKETGKKEKSQHSQSRKGSSAAIPKSHHLRMTCILHANSRIDPKNHLLKGTAGLNRCCIEFQPCQSVKCLKLDRRLWCVINGLFPLPDPGLRNQGSLTDVTLHIKCYVPIPR